jgi:zona occludens toxin (predicted ATPase)
MWVGVVSLTLKGLDLCFFDSQREKNSDKGKEENSLQALDRVSTWKGQGLNHRYEKWQRM